MKDDTFTFACGCKAVKLDNGRWARKLKHCLPHATRGTYWSALRKIAKGEGTYSNDPITHANNCIEEMKAIAKSAIDKAEPDGGVA